MEQGFRRGFTAAEKTELWDRWQRGESLTAIGRTFGKPSSSIRNQLAPHGGIRPASRRRSQLALTLPEREEISRGLASHQSARSIANLLGRSASTVSRGLKRNGGYQPEGCNNTAADQQSRRSAFNSFFSAMLQHTLAREMGVITCRHINTTQPLSCFELNRQCGGCEVALLLLKIAFAHKWHLIVFTSFQEIVAAKATARANRSRAAGIQASRPATAVRQASSH